ncbi:MFS transporter [Campylobacter sp. faydin G-24]|uniref:MFS transporter n=1 Tax=Campylobacter anatolicus TaxID=2829105 RepID=A0ABS5HGZ2_9BACT|nr:MFS transporter [Campylobacter anatolicus]MBR8461630.1 MFS transporter [Campylobacter anatolicus]MBR8463367.1 MFS transporter [Campylobacter anatolicus]
MLKSVLPLSFIVGSRFFGIFIVLPVLSLYALNLKGANEFLIGLLIGAYAIMQMIFQVPFGTLSDKIGRKKTLTIGLVIFIIGSFICAGASDIYTMIGGRLVQGIGAIGAVATAMISDYTKEEIRSRAMAVMGAFIGLGFALSMVLSPILSQKYGLDILFYISAGLSIFCIILLYLIVPKEPKVVHHDEKVPFSKLIFEKDLLIMNITSMFQKMFTSIAFLAIPIVLVKELGYAQADLWKVYAISTSFGFVAMGFGGFLGDGKGFSKAILLVGVALFILSYSVFAVSSTATFFIVGVVIFFIGFNLHEPIMQSCATKFAKSNQKGAALGVFNSFGYFGSFFGGVIGGHILHAHSFGILAVFCIVVCIFWFGLLCYLKDPRVFKNLYFSLDKRLNLGVLNSTKGIIEHYKTNKNQVIKFDTTLIDELEIERICKS